MASNDPKFWSGEVVWIPSGNIDPWSLAISRLSDTKIQKISVYTPFTLIKSPIIKSKGESLVNIFLKLIRASFFIMLSLNAYGTERTPDQTRQLIQSLNWIKGPTVVNVGVNAKFVVPENYVFLNPQDTKIIMEALQNPSSGRQSYFGPSDMRWWALFDYEETGHVADDGKIDATPLLESIKQGTEAGNKERAKHGWAPMTIIGWRYQPFYDPTTKRLEWAIDGQSGAERVINFNTRILGRTGVTSATLVAVPEILDTAVPEFKTVVSGYDYVSGQKYSEVREGDHMAEYGLAALVAGGAAAVASKKGLWAVIVGVFAAAWKFLAVAAVASLGWLRSLFKKKE